MSSEKIAKIIRYLNLTSISTLIIGIIIFMRNKDVKVVTFIILGIAIITSVISFVLNIIVVKKEKKNKEID